jgi:glycosyltransferase involved in cell wall biosynthesis
MTASRRVLYLAPSSRQPGALSRYSFLDEEIRALADAGVEAYVLSYAERADTDEGRIHLRAVPPDSLSERGRTITFASRHLGRMPIANLIEFQRWYRGVRIERLAAEVVAREGIDIIHSFFGWPRGLGGQLAQAETGKPLIAGLRGADVNVLADHQYGSRLEPSFDRTVRRLLRTADLTVAVSEFVRQQAISLGARPETSRVILKGVRLDRFQPVSDRIAARMALGLDAGPMILAVAGLVPIKGLDDVLSALGRLQVSGRRVSAVICGEGQQRQALEAQASALNLPSVRLPGKVGRDQIAGYFAAADLFVHGALIEASGNVLLEAMASGLPVVCTDAGGPAEYVRDGETGFVVPVRDPAAMCSRLRQLLDDEALRARMSRQARERTMTEFDYGRMIAQTLSLYDEVSISKRRAASKADLAVVRASKHA